MQVNLLSIIWDILCTPDHVFTFKILISFKETGWVCNEAHFDILTLLLPSHFYTVNQERGVVTRLPPEKSVNKSQGMNKYHGKVCWASCFHTNQNCRNISNITSHK